MDTATEEEEGGVGEGVTGEGETGEEEVERGRGREKQVRKRWNGGEGGRNR